jgi:hypothetical protein
MGLGGVVVHEFATPFDHKPAIAYGLTASLAYSETASLLMFATFQTSQALFADLRDVQKPRRRFH